MKTEQVRSCILSVIIKYKEHAYKGKETYVENVSPITFLYSFHARNTVFVRKFSLKCIEGT